MAEEIDIEIVSGDSFSSDEIDTSDLNGSDDSAGNPVADEDKGSGDDQQAVDDPNMIDTADIIAAQENDNTSHQDSDSPSSALNIPLIQALDAEGIIEFNEEKSKEFDSVADYLKFALDEQISKRELADLNDEQAEFLKAMRSGVNFEDYIKVKNEQQKAGYSDDSVKGSESIQSEVYKRSLIEKGYTPEEAEELVDDAKTLKKLESKALKANEYLKALAREKEDKLKADSIAQREAIRKRNEEAYNDAKKVIDSKKEILPGVKLTDGRKSSIFSNMTKPVREEGGQPISYIQDVRSKNPLEFDIKLNYYAEMGLFDENPNIEEIVGQMRAASSKTLEKILDTKDMTIKGTGNRNKGTQGNDIMKAVDSILGL